MTDYIYAITDENNRIHYIGKSNNPNKRLREHKSAKESWFMAIDKAQISILETVSRSSDPLERERFWINEMDKRGEPLANVQRGNCDELIAFRPKDEDWDIIQNIQATHPDLENVTSRAIRKALRFWLEYKDSGND